MKKVLLFPNGNTAVFDENGEQVPGAQASWILLVANFLKKHEIEPTEAEYTMPDGTKVEVFKVKHGYNWRPK